MSKPTKCPKCFTPDPKFIAVRQLGEIGTVEVWQCTMTPNTFPKCNKRWWRYWTPLEKSIEGGSAWHEDELFGQAERQIPKKLEALIQAEERREQLKAEVLARVDSVDSNDALSLRAIFKAENFPINDWDARFLKSIAARVGSGQSLSEKQRAVLADLFKSSQECMN